MSDEIYLIFEVRPSEFGYAVSQADLQRQTDEMAQELAKTGGEYVLVCRTDWSSGEWTVFGVERYPNFEALMKQKDYQMRIGWHRNLISRAYLGVLSPDQERPMPVTADPGGIYKLVLMRMTPAAYALSLPQREEALKRDAEDLARLGVTTVVGGSVISSERFTYFSVQHYPSMDVVIEHHRCMEESEWFQYTDADVLLGTFWG